MATFSEFTNILPDPNNLIGEAGQAGGNGGPGFASIKLASEHKQMNTRTNSGRLISRELSGHKWNIDLTYNPMTRTEFEPVYSFLLQKRGSLSPFFVSLPQYKQPRNSAFATFVGSNTFTTAAAGDAGADNLMVTHASFDKSSNGKASPGDLFTVTDSSDSNHVKVYQVTRVEDEDDNLNGSTAPATAQLRIHFAPSLQRAVSSGANIIFNDPKFRVILASDVQEYSLNADNLYSFSLKLEEAQP